MSQEVDALVAAEAALETVAAAVVSALDKLAAELSGALSPSADAVAINGVVAKMGALSASLEAAVAKDAPAAPVTPPVPPAAPVTPPAPPAP